jgi:hypothetical protein
MMHLPGPIADRSALQSRRFLSWSPPHHNDGLAMGRSASDGAFSRISRGRRVVRDSLFRTISKIRRVAGPPARSNG